MEEPGGSIGNCRLIGRSWVFSQWSRLTPARAGSACSQLLQTCSFAPVSQLERRGYTCRVGGQRACVRGGVRAKTRALDRTRLTRWAADPVQRIQQSAKCQEILHLLHPEERQRVSSGFIHFGGRAGVSARQDGGGNPDRLVKSASTSSSTTMALDGSSCIASLSVSSDMSCRSHGTDPFDSPRRYAIMP